MIRERSGKTVFILLVSSKVIVKQIELGDKEHSDNWECYKN